MTMPIIVRADRQPITVPEADARWLASELRATIAGPLPDEYITAAVQIEHAMEDAPEQLIVFEEPERAAVLKVLESHARQAWLPDALSRLASAMLEEIAHERR